MAYERVFCYKPAIICKRHFKTRLTPQIVRARRNRPCLRRPFAILTERATSRRVVDLTRARKALLEGDVRVLCQELTALFPNQATPNRTRQMVRYALGDNPAPRTTDPGEQVFLESIAITRRLLSGEPLEKPRLPFHRQRSGFPGRPGGGGRLEYPAVPEFPPFGPYSAAPADRRRHRHAR